MKKLFLRSVSTSLICLAAFSAKAWANTISYTAPTDNKDGKFTGELPIDHIGSLLLPNGQFRLKGDTAEVMAVPDWLFDRNLVLSGFIINPEFVAVGKEAALSGTVFFGGGDWLTQLAGSRAIDQVDTKSGTIVRGRIIAKQEEALVIKPANGPAKRIALVDVKSISSPRAYKFNIPAVAAKIDPAANSLTMDSDLVRFAPTLMSGRLIAKQPSLPPSNLAGADPGISKSAIASMIGIDVVNMLAPGVVIPLVLNRGTQIQALRRISLYDTEQLRASGVNVPLSYTTFY